VAHRRRLWPWLASALVLLLLVGGLAMADVGPGEVGPSLGMTANGRALHPVGRMTTVGNFPTGSVLTPNGRYLWVADCGHGSNDVRVMSVATGMVVQTLPLPGCYGAIAMAADGSRAYVGGTPKGGSPTEGPTRGDEGDVIHVFDVDQASGQGTERNPLVLPSTSAGSGRVNSLPPVTSSHSAFPEALAISPDQRKLVVSLNAADRAVVVDLPSGQQTTVTTGRYPNGVAFDHQGRAYVSNEFDGTLTVIDVGQAKAVATIAGLGGAGGDQNSHPEGMTIDPRADRLYVAVTNRDEISTVDTQTRRVITQTSVGRAAGVGTAPVKLAVSPDAHTLYAADSGEDAVTAIALTRRPPVGTPVIPRRVVRPSSIRSIARYRALQRRAARVLAHIHGRRRRAGIRRYHRRLHRLVRRYLAIRNLSACLGPSRRQADAFTGTVLRAVSLRAHGRAHGRRQARRRARALARRRRLLLAQARRRLPSISACQASPGFIPDLAPGQVIGRLPTAAYTSDVQVTPDGSQLLWVAGKGLGSGPNPSYSFDGDKRPGATPSNVYGTYVLDQLLGRVGALPIPSDIQMQAATGLADAQVAPVGSTESQPAGNPVPAPGSGPSSQIKHVFYIVKENRTYDQVFGSDRRGDGDPNLALFDDNGVPGPTGGITPNAHKLTRTFPLIDHLYADSEVSVDGHVITSSAYANDYVQKALAANYSNRNRGFDFGIYPVTFPPKDFVFDQAVRQGVSFMNYGEAGAGNSPMGNDGRPTYSAVASHSDQAYPNNLFIGCLRPAGAVGNLATCTQDSGEYKGTGKAIGAQSRFNEFRAQFSQQLASNSVPTFNYMILPNDHTNGTTSGDYSPQALVADNDLALGQIVDEISHSSIWASTAIMVVEDDSQDGADHVDSHRMPAYVISPWAKRGAVVHTRYDQYSMLHTIELLCGLAPLSLNDALATPMYDAFDSRADVEGTRYSVVAPTQDIGQVNGGAAALARVSDQLPLNRLDRVPQETLDRILWASVHGAASTPPAPGPNASPVEHQRAVDLERVLRRHGSARALLSGRGDG